MRSAIKALVVLVVIGLVGMVLVVVQSRTQKTPFQRATQAWSKNWASYRFPAPPASYGSHEGRLSVSYDKFADSMMISTTVGRSLTPQLAYSFRGMAKPQEPPAYVMVSTGRANATRLDVIVDGERFSSYDIHDGSSLGVSYLLTSDLLRIVNAKHVSIRCGTDQDLSDADLVRLRSFAALLHPSTPIPVITDVVTIQTTPTGSIASDK